LYHLCMHADVEFSCPDSNALNEVGKQSMGALRTWGFVTAWGPYKEIFGVRIKEYPRLVSNRCPLTICSSPFFD
jgi:hypothetical protein